MTKNLLYLIANNCCKMNECNLKKNNVSNNYINGNLFWIYI